MSRFPALLVTLAIVAASPCSALRAQPSLALHAGRGPDIGAPWLFGATLAVGAHGIGLRAGGAVNSLPALFDSDPDAPDPLWAVDADVMLGVPTGAGVNPYLFLGAGMQTAAADDLVEDALTHWSWGGGISISVFGPASIFGEARRRKLFDRTRSSALAPGSAASELRAGLAIDFGGGSEPERGRRHPRRRRGGHHLTVLPAPRPSDVDGQPCGQRDVVSRLRVVVADEGLEAGDVVARLEP